MSRENKEYKITASKDVNYYTPAQEPQVGALVLKDDLKVPKLFTPLKIRGLTLVNRIMLSPLCQYSSDEGRVTFWHKSHLGSIAMRGIGLICVEATAVQAEGRITPHDNGLWDDTQIEGLKEIVSFAHSQGAKMMIQLGHAGRKASTFPPWICKEDLLCPAEQGGWPDQVYAASDIPYSDKCAKPKSMTVDQIKEFKNAFNASVKRALQCGFDCIEIHAAHGYLITTFLSALTNKRTDEYGGSFENRIRLLLEIVEQTRETIPDSMPLFVRVSASDQIEGEENSWEIEDTIKLGHLLAERGVDLYDMSNGGNTHGTIKAEPGYLTHFAKQAKNELGSKILVSTVGFINTAKLANDLLEKDNLDLIVVGRGLQKNPGLVFKWADELEVLINYPNQIRWGFYGVGMTNKGNTLLDRDDTN